MLASVLALLLTTQESHIEIEPDIRFSFVGGDAIADTKWSDFWDTGIGVKFGVNQLWHTSERVSLGVSVSLSYDGYVGGSYSEFDSGLGETIFFEPDALGIVKVMGGFISRFHLGEVFLDLRIAAGTALFMSTDVHMTSPSLDENFEAVASTATYCIDLAARVGFKMSEKVSLGVALGVDFIGAPDAGDGFVPGTEFDPMRNFVLSIGVDVRL